MRGRKVRRLTIAALSAPLLVAGLVLPTQAQAADPPDQGRFSATELTPSKTVTGTKSLSSRLAKTDPKLLSRSDSAMVPVLIKLDHDATASYTGGREALRATSPRVTGKPLTENTAAVQAYERFQKSREDEVVRQLQKAVPKASIGTRLRTVYGGFAATIPANTVKTVLGIDGVTAVQMDELRKPLTDSSPQFIDAPPVYNQLGGVANAGEGIIYGNLDSGVWPEHPSFADQGNLKPPPGPARVCDFGDNPLTAANDPFVCNNKLIGGQAFLDAYLSNPTRAAAEPFKTARDSNGHGTHTSSTTAGNIVKDVSILGSKLPPIHGIAPGAWLMEYKVCGVDGCFSSDSAAAVQQAIADGVDVINFSISGGTDPFTDPVELAFLDAYAAGVFVSASAGNDGPGAGTANHLSPWVMTVGASTQEREFATTLTLKGSDGATATFEGASIMPGVGEFPVVLSSAAPYSDDLCQKPAPAGTFTGKIVACKRGTNARVDKGYNVLQGGAEGMILYNATLADVETDTHWLPTVHLADGRPFLAFMGAHPGVVGSWPAGAAKKGQGDVMASFSSRGPAGLFIKPDVTAPGVQILAGDTPIMESITSGPAGEYFQAIAGTSMSSPHVAGAAVLVRAVHPDWTPGQIKSALMTSSLTDVLKEDAKTPADPFDMGAGRIDVARSAGVSLTFDETADRFFALGGNPVTAVDLNLPSVNAPTMPGELTTSRTVKNVSSQTQVVKVSASAPSGSSITVSPSNFTVPAGKTATFKITIRSGAADGKQRFGQVNLSPNRGPALHLPVAWVAKQGTVSLHQSCAPDSIARGTDSTCTVQAVNTSFNASKVTIDSTTTSNLRVTAADGATVVNNQHVRAAATLTPAQPGVPSMADGGLFGYLPLQQFGIGAQSVGDEAMLTFNVPAYVYNGKTYSSLTVDSNGYVLAGTAGAEQNNCCDLPGGPDPAPPNDMMAPFWTDLDGTGARGISAGLLGDGVNNWVVVQYEVNVWGTQDLRSFQVWIGINGEQDITYAYAAPQADPNGQDFLVGAENEIGQGDMQAVLPTSDKRITSTDPTPGGSLTYTFRVLGQAPGAGEVVSRMTATGVPGVTETTSRITVRAK
ncbi:MAG TPA: S8 family serine peptidase [Actinomycetales bacterium]|nr:S8 family serine peptidase [Actinomycetales bacterium]